MGLKELLQKWGLMKKDESVEGGEVQSNNEEEVATPTETEEDSEVTVVDDDSETETEEAPVSTEMPTKETDETDETNN
jgi:hypothetical protein